MNRRQFIKNGFLALLAVKFLPSNANRKCKKLIILHTNDLHSHIDPFPANHRKYANRGGMLAVYEQVKKIRAKHKNVLLLDSGDIFQGTPYFNIFGGKVEYKLMSKMGYAASTLGNHDFDNGISGLINMETYKNFPFLNCNYNFKNSLLNGKINEYKIVEYEGVKIGITGVGVELNGLVNDKLYEGVLYKNPIKSLNNTAKKLKTMGCKYIICLSHLGYSYTSDKVSDLKMATQTSDVDIILGGHTHTFLDKPTYISNKNNNKVLVSQAGWAGLKLGRIDIDL